MDLNLILNLDWLKVFYLAGAILLLAIAILVYPTILERSRKKK